jgi:aspartyl aminopeptidase
MAKGKGKLEEKLEMKREHAWDRLSRKEKSAAEELSRQYRGFLDGAKTEREAVLALQRIAEDNGFVPLDTFFRPPAPDTRTPTPGSRLPVPGARTPTPDTRLPAPGTRVFFVWKNKCMALAVLGAGPPSAGVSIIGSHVDSPRLDLKQNPVFEESDTKMALLRTHYYGGIKKYQWATIPLALHGKVVLNSGKEIDLCIGESAEDPVFTIEDLAPHLYRQSQAKRHLDEGFKGEELSALAASLPIESNKKSKSRTKLALLDHLNRAYGMTEEDFASAELELVPAGNAREAGFDRSLVLGYGQDDRICAFASLKAMCDLGVPRRTAVALFYDKEEIGSEGNTSARSRLMISFIARIMSLLDGESSDMAVRTALENSVAISADTTSALDPIFKDVHEASNAARLGYGVVLTKFTGSGGKSMASDASAEFVGRIRRMLNSAKIPWQSAELGKVDEGGGGRARNGRRGPWSGSSEPPRPE